MGRPKGGTNKYWTAEEKYEVIKPIINFEKSSSQVTKETGINNGMISVWVKKYNVNGLENKRKPGNPMSSLMNKKNLTDIEKLELENMKLRIENERLKKGYLVKGDGSIVAFKK